MPANNSNAQPGRSRLWWWFVAAFLLQAAAWIVWFMIAAEHRVAEVPVVAS